MGNLEKARTVLKCALEKDKVRKRYYLFLWRCQECKTCKLAAYAVKGLVGYPLSNVTLRCVLLPPWFPGTRPRCYSSDVTV